MRAHHLVKNESPSDPFYIFVVNAYSVDSGNGTVLGELLGGFAAGQRENVHSLWLAQFINAPRVKVVPSTASTADLYALVYAALRRKDQPIPTNDLWIAASSLEHGAALLTLDAHFQYIDGLHAGTRLDDFIP